MSYPIDSSTFSAFREGDNNAFSVVFHSYYRPLYYFTRKLIDNKEEAEEIVLNSFLKLFQRCALVESPDALKAFLYITTKNNCFDYFRANKSLRTRQKEFMARMENDTLLQYEHDIKDQLVEMVRKAVNDLPRECRKIFEMLYYQDLTPAEVAEILQISVSTVYNQKSRALQLLRMALSDHPLAIAFLYFSTLYLQDVEFIHYKVVAR